jgi:hypothetical protein
MNIAPNEVQRYTYNSKFSTEFKNWFVQGKVSDPNLNMNFDGLVDLSKKKDSRFISYQC